MLIQITPEEVQKARGTNHLDDMDMIQSPHGGHLVVVAQKRDSSGMLLHVCWACGEPFEPEHRALAGVEKTPPGGTVPVLLHRKCNEERRTIIDLGQASRGLRLRRTLAQGMKFAAKIVGG
ncbi:MAG: hypothetical protein ACRCSL_04715 [Microbacterium sp.]